MLEKLIDVQTTDNFRQYKEKLQWRRLSEIPDLDKNRSHIWRVDLERTMITPDPFMLFSADEQARIDRFISHEKKESFIAGRTALRSILSRYTNQPPQKVTFNYLQDGKPVLAEERHSNCYQFNVSHSGKWMLVIVNYAKTVGIDIESIRPIKHINWALENLFSAQDREKFGMMPVRIRDLVFITGWTKKEAILKSLGKGISGDSRHNVLDEKQTVDLSGRTCSVHQKAPFWFIQFSPAPGYVGTAAIMSEQKPVIQYFDYEAMRASEVLRNTTYPTLKMISRKKL